MIIVGAIGALVRLCVQVTQYKKSAESKQAQGRRRQVKLGTIVSLLPQEFTTILLYIRGLSGLAAVFQPLKGLDSTCTLLSVSRPTLEAATCHHGPRQCSNMAAGRHKACHNFFCCCQSGGSMFQPIEHTPCLSLWS